MFKLNSLVLAAALCLVSGCTTIVTDPRSAPGTGGAQVIAAYGTPTRIWSDPDGGRTLEYSSQPYGNTCYMIKLDKDDRVVSKEDTLQSAGRARVQVGMTTEQVNRLLGRERSRMFFPLSGEDVWDWNVDPGGIAYLVRFNVHFKGGRVVRTSQSLVDPRDYRMMGL